MIEEGKTTPLASHPRREDGATVAPFEPFDPTRMKPADAKSTLTLRLAWLTVRIDQGAETDPPHPNRSMLVAEFWATRWCLEKLGLYDEDVFKARRARVLEKLAARKAAAEASGP